jgi:multiple sugar transport system substrate-binding protein
MTQPERPSRRRLLGVLAVQAAAVGLLAACGGAVATTSATVPAATSASSSAPATTAAAVSSTTAKSETASASTSSAATSSVSSAAQSTATATSVAASGASSASAGTLRVAIYGTAPQIQVWSKLLTAYQQVHAGAKLLLESTPSGDVFYNKVLAEAAGGTPSDVMMFETKRMPAYANQSFFLDLDGPIATSAQVHPADYFTFSWKKGQLHGKQYAISWDESPAVIFYNPDLFKQNGLTLPPTTWNAPGWDLATFLDVCQKLAKGGDKPVFAVHNSDWWVYALPYIWANGADVLNADYTKSTLTSAGSLAGFQYLYDLRWKYHVDPTPAQAKLGDTKMFDQGLLAMVPKIPDFASSARQDITHVPWEVAPYPSGSAGAWTRSPDDALTAAAATRLADDSWKFIEWACGAPGQTILIEIGRVPTRTDVAYGPYLQQQPAINWRMIVDGTRDHQGNQAVTDQWNTMDALLKSHWEDVFDKNASSPQAFAEAMTGPVDALLAKATYRRIIPR